MRQFPSDRVADGWYQIGWSNDFEAGQTTPLAYFDRELVAYRGESGALHLLDAYCRHMGAHLGHGGCVEGEGVRCPYHGWKWEPDGANSDIPYSRPERMGNLQLGSYPTRELDGVAFAYFNYAGEPPTYELPSSFERYDGNTWTLSPDTTHTWLDVPMSPQFVVENSADAAHFKYVHRSADVATVGDYSAEEGVFKTRVDIRFGGHVASTWATPNGAVDGHIYTESWSLGLGWSRLIGFDDVIFMLGVTPITPYRADLRSSTWVCRTRSDGTEMDVETRDRWVKQQNGQVDADLKIWSTQTYIARAALARSEQGCIRAVREWSQQFYSDRRETAVSLHS